MFGRYFGARTIEANTGARPDMSTADKRAIAAAIVEPWAN